MTKCGNYDLVDMAVIGAGPAGLTAAMYGARAGLTTYIFGDPYAGQLAKAGIVENFITMTGTPSGLQVIEKMVAHAEDFGAKLIDTEIKQIIRDEEGHFTLIDGNGDGTCSITAILATGTKHKKLGIKGEEKYYAKGVGYCTICDGPLYKDANVGIVGYGNEMVQAALRMASIASELYVYGSKVKIGADPELIDELDSYDNVRIIENVRPIEVIGNGDGVTGFMYKHSDIEFTDELDALFIEIGVLPSSTIAEGVGVELSGNFVKVDRSQQTNVPGFYAAGDITGGIARQAVVSAGDGARAAISAMDFIKETGVSTTKIKKFQWGASKEMKKKEEKLVQEEGKNQLYAYVHSDDGFTAQYNRYNPDLDAIAQIKDKFNDVKLITVSAHWCPDCRRNVPRVAKIAEQIPFADVIVEDRDAEGIREKYNVRKIPTFIFQDSEGNEIARIIENPKYRTLEEDLLKIASKLY